MVKKEEIKKEKEEVKSKTTVKQCSCEHKYQDGIYGQKKRLHNRTQKTSGSKTVYRCTGCGNEK